MYHFQTKKISNRENRFLFQIGSPESRSESSPRETIIETTHGKLDTAQEKMQNEIFNKTLERSRKGLTSARTPEERQKVIVSMLETTGLTDEGLSDIIESLHEARSISATDFELLMRSERATLAQRAVEAMRMILIMDLRGVPNVENLFIVQSSLYLFTTSLTGMLQTPVRSQEMLNVRLEALETYQLFALSSGESLGAVLPGTEDVLKTMNSYLNTLRVIEQNLSRPPQGAAETTQERSWREQLRAAVGARFDSGAREAAEKQRRE